MALRTMVVAAVWAALALGLSGCPSSARVMDERDLTGEADAAGVDVLAPDGGEGAEIQAPEGWDGWEGPGPEGLDWVGPEGWEAHEVDAWEAHEAEGWDGWDAADDARPEEWVGPEGFEWWEAHEIEAWEAWEAWEVQEAEAWDGWEGAEPEEPEVLDTKEAWDTAEGLDTAEGWDTAEVHEVEPWDTGTEEHTPECQVDADCEDGDPCTDQACDQGECHYALIPWCCNGDAQCHDANPCTKDQCVDQACVFTQVFGCCTQPSDCSDDNLCTWDLCTNGTCYFYPTTEHPGCCDGAAACDDGDPCTRDSCGADWHCSYADLEGCCTGDAACDDGDPCSVDSCDAGACVYLPDFSPECCQPSTPYYHGFEDGQAGGLKLEPTNKSVGWSVSSKRAASGTYSLYFGDPMHGSFEIPGQPSLGTATLPVLQLPPLYPARFSMLAWLDVEALPNYDRLWVEVVFEGQATPVWDKLSLPASQYRTWITVSADLTPWAGKAVKVRVRFDSVDAMENTGEGVYLDELRVEGLCQPYAPLAGDAGASPR